MSAFTPQSMLYRARGPMADGNAYRNRSAEQAYTFSGNPNMPIFNQAQQVPAAPVSGGIASKPIPMNAMGTPQLNHLQQLRMMGTQSPIMNRGSMVPRQAVMPVSSSPAYAKPMQMAQQPLLPMFRRM